MDDEYKITISDLIALYENEPGLRDIYVEGESDADILKWFSANSESTNTKIFDSGTVNIPSEIIPPDESGHRGRVVGLANEFTVYFKQHMINVMCVIDKDFDDLSNNKHKSKYLKSTDYANMEMYLFSKEHLRKFFELALRKNYEDNIYDQLSISLQELFLIRYTKKLLYSNKSWPNIERSFSADHQSGQINFNINEFISKLIGCHQNSQRVQAFLGEMEKHRPKLNDDCRYQIHGHDLLQLLTWYAKNINAKNTLCNTESIAANLRMNLNYEKFSEFPLMTFLLKWSST